MAGKDPQGNGDRSNSDDDDDDDRDLGEKVRICLYLAPSVQDRSLQVPSEPIAVPANIGRKGLAAVVNHLLGRTVNEEKEKETSQDDDDDGEQSDSDENDKNSSPPLAFEFIVASEPSTATSSATSNAHAQTASQCHKLLRKGIEREARQNGLSLEHAIAITYFPATPAPKMEEEPTEPLPDWVSCLATLGKCSGKLDPSNQLFVCAGSYDGSIYLYAQKENENDEHKNKLSVVNSASISTGPIKCIDTVSISGQQKTTKTTYVASACLDHALKVHSVDVDAKEGSHKLKLYADLSGEDSTSAVTSMDFLPSNTSLVLATGDRDGRILLWDLEAHANSETSAKKQKSDRGANAAKILQPTLSLDSAHSQLISGLSWGNHHKRLNDADASSLPHLISGSWDHSLKLWDVENQNCLLTVNGSRVVSCLDTSYYSPGIVATGHPDCTVRLWDVRADEDNAKPSSLLTSDSTFKTSHRAWITSVAWSQTNAYLLASTSHDGTVKVWDLRSSSPLHTVRAFPKGEKSFCMLWDSFEAKHEKNLDTKYGSTMFVGGTDCILKQLAL